MRARCPREARAEQRSKCSAMRMPEGGLELSNPPCFRNLQTLLTHWTHRTHKTQALHTLGTHAPISAKRRERAEREQATKRPMESLKFVHTALRSNYQKSS